MHMKSANQAANAALITGSQLRSSIPKVFGEGLAQNAGWGGTNHDFKH